MLHLHGMLFSYWFSTWHPEACSANSAVGSNLSHTGHSLKAGRSVPKRNKLFFTVNCTVACVVQLYRTISTLSTYNGLCIKGTVTKCKHD